MDNDSGYAALQPMDPFFKQALFAGRRLLLGFDFAIKMIIFAG